MNQGNYGILLLPSHNETLCIPLETIVRVEASSSYSKVYCNDKPFPIVASKILRWFEERLPEQIFLRVHRTHLVNRNYMVSIRKNKIMLESGTIVTMSRRKKKDIFAVL